MHILRKLALGILSPLFVFLLFATAFDIGFVRTATHPATIKKIVAESGIYDSIVPNLIKQAGSISTPLGDLSASDPAVLQAAQQAVGAQNVQKQTEAAIDSGYQWLDGTVGQPDFTIGLAANGTDFANNISSVVQHKLVGLPACSTAQSLAIVRGGNFDAVNATCLPRGVTAAEVAAGVKASIAANQGLLNQASISSADIKSGGSGHPVFQQPGIKKIPQQYQRAKKTPFILTVLTILTGAAIVVLSRDWPRGLRHIGINLLAVGLLMLVFSWALNRTMNTKVIPKIKVNNAVLQTDLRHLAADLTQQVDKNYWFFGGLYAVLGAAAITGGQAALRQRNKVKTLDDVSIDLVPHPKKK